jgi:hypothetical protein
MVGKRTMSLWLSCQPRPLKVNIARAIPVTVLTKEANQPLLPRTAYVRYRTVAYGPADRMTVHTVSLIMALNISLQLLTKQKRNKNTDFLVVMTRHDWTISLVVMTRRDSCHDLWNLCQPQDWSLRRTWSGRGSFLNFLRRAHGDQTVR